MRCFFLPLLQAVAWLAGRLPQRGVLALGQLLSWVLWPALGSRRRIARINVELCFSSLDAAARRRLADIEGIQHLRAALDRGQGVLLMCGHFTHTELAVRLLGEALGRPVRVVVRRHNNACLERWFERSRAAVYGPSIGKKDVRGLIRALQAGEPVVYSADQNFTYQNAFVPFFGMPAATLTATPELVRRGRAVLLPFWYRRGDDGRYRIRIEAGWPSWPSDDPVEDAARYMRELEAVVRECPEQYLWAHRRFKTRPPGEPPVY